jgi:MoxR-like ATPase
MKDNSRFDKLRQFVQGKIIGQDKLVNRLMIALLAEGHLLVEGAPGLAKTRAVNVFSEVLEGDFQRIQFTPDLLPADITGSEIFRPATGTFHFQHGPLFHNLILADEINRAPAKVQSALLEAMAEQQVTIANRSYPLPNPFMVMATQNPIEQEGTYHLPEAQLDRFLMHVTIGYPSLNDEKSILQLGRREAMQKLVLGDKEREKKPILSKKALTAAKKSVLSLYMAENIEEYVLQLIMATRNPAVYRTSLTDVIAFGASPRATLALDRCARAHAWLASKDYVGPEDVQAVAHDVLRHRLILSFEAEAKGLSSDGVIDDLLGQVAVP